jgi:hypothetical protein
MIGRPTRLPGWDVFVLVAHLTRTIKTLADYAALGPEAPALPAVSTDPAEAGREVDARARFRRWSIAIDIAIRAEPGGGRNDRGCSAPWAGC